MGFFPCFIIKEPPPVRFSGQAVSAGKPNTLPVFRGGGFTCVSRGAYCATLDGKTKSRAGRVRPAVAVWQRGRQEAALKQKKTQTRTFVFFSTLRPPATAGGCPSPFEPLKDGFATGTERSGVERVNPSYCLMSGGSPAARGRDNMCRRHTATGVRWA
jgi:hypothetical protein